MIAEVIPYTRAIRGKDAFDYTIPDEMDVRIGSIVEIEFRSNTLFGLVRAIKKRTSVPKVKPLLSVTNQQHWHEPYRLQLLQWFATYYFVSETHAFKTLQHNLLKRPRKNSATPIPHAPGVIEQPSHTAALKLVQNEKPYLAHYSHRSDCLSWYNTYVQTQTGAVLIVVPEYHDIQDVRQGLPSSVTAYAWTDNQSPSELLEIEERIHQAYSAQESLVIIATKKAVALPLHLFTTIILDQEESSSHKQYHLNPRYHIRTVLLHATQLLEEAQRPKLIFSSTAPSMYSAHQVDNKQFQYIDLRRPWNNDHISIINMEDERQNKNYSWFSDTLRTAIEESDHILLFLNRTGSYGVSLCKDCSQLLSAEEGRCSNCGSSEIQHKRKGLTALEKELSELFPSKTIFRVDSSVEISASTDPRFLNADIVIATEKIFRHVPVSFFDCVGILSVDHLLLYPDFRAHERVYQLLIRLFTTGTSVILQSSAVHHSVIQHAFHNAYEKFSKEELRIRKSLALPPFAERFRLINTKTKEVSDPQPQVETETLDSHMVIDRIE